MHLNSYNYFVLPFCGRESAAVDQDLGETLTGDRKVELPYEIGFKKDVEFKEVCVKVRALPRPPFPHSPHPLFVRTSHSLFSTLFLP